MVCVHGTGKLLASSARQAAPGLCEQSWEHYTDRYPGSLTLAHHIGQSSFLSAHPSVLLTPCGSVSTFPEPGRTKKLSGFLSEHLALHRALTMCVAHPYVTGDIHLFQIHWQFSNLPAKGRHFGTALILFYSSKEAKPSLEGDVKVLLQCLEQQMASSVYAEKSGMNQREEVVTRLSGYTVHPSRNAGNQTNHKGKKNNHHPPRGPLPG